MKKLFLLLLFYATVLNLKSQTTITDSIYSGGIYRTYRLYIPAIFNGGITARPLILNLHGYTSNASAQQLYSNFMPIADTANFLMVYPQGTKDLSGKPFWNAGISSLGVNDIGFLSNLIDSLSANYNINLNRVYSTGMSNGGFMSHTLACELSSKIAAIASVTGSIFTTQYGNNCHPLHPVPVMQISGTSDPTVPYNGDLSQNMMPIDSVVKYWVIKNNCNTVPVFSNVPNTNTLDGCTAEHYVYVNGDHGSSVELYKIIGGTHTWPGFPYGGVGTNLDINASVEIWRFFSKYSLSTVTKANELFKSNSSVVLFPNPTSSLLNIKIDKELIVNVEILDIFGKVILSNSTQTNSISVENLQSGIYFVSIKTESGVEVNTKFIKE
jgi:polyhydroxybutyrate depolymerase